ncbi:signal transduction protein with CBS domains [Natronococcus amylolyticus DSM 10524]|uniref:Signal transduction protein with CBS domains n=1 Tax=Natronococcus amylolyticus DSM 10524 TaxID=1227497 RepID=L9WYS2_9EURY|nr:hypothetical protein [Natronococcus amylolyticus]ELY54635.1 signal transduction protein with CBS domains [Natronococcus amylolyticus DSM 10524]
MPVDKLGPEDVVTARPVDDFVATIGEQLENVSETIEVQSPGYSP